MLRLIGKFTFNTIILGVIFINTVACGSLEQGTVGEAAASATAIVIEPQSVLEATPTATLKPTPTSEPTATAVPSPSATELATEIIEPSSPISPSVAAEGAEMELAEDSGQPIPGGEEALAAAMADLSEQTGIPADEISLVSMEAVDWSDTSLGCPQPGHMYAQVITPGYKMVLAARDQQYQYHTDQATNVVLCEE